MNILVTGATGFIGQRLCQRLVAHGHRLLVLSRHPRWAARFVPEGSRIIDSVDKLGDDEKIDGIVNLAGESLWAGRWTQRRKKALIRSREETTKALVTLVSRLERKPAVMVSGSSVMFYGNAGNMELDETSAARKKDFGYLLCDTWEQAARPVSRQGVRLCVIRTGVVLGRDGGILAALLPLYRLGLGAMAGTGWQWLSWVHIDDAVAAWVHALETPGVEGTFNAVAPNPVTQRDFHLALKSHASKGLSLRIPETLLKLGLGEQSNLLLGGQKVKPVRLEQSGFLFRYLTLDNALDHIAEKKK